MISHWRTSVTRVMIHSVNTFPVREGNTLTVDNPVSDDTSLLEITLHVKQNYWIAADSLEDCNFVIATSRWLPRSRWKTTQDWCMRMMMSFGRAREQLHVSLFTRHARPETFVKTSLTQARGTVATMYFTSEMQRADGKIT